MVAAQQAPVAGRTYGGLSTTERKERRREAFLAAGLQLFGTVGFRGTTVRSLCKEAGLTGRYFYESFENMEALLAAVYEECIEDFRGRVAETFGATGADSDPEAMVLAGLDIFFAWVEDPRVTRVCWREVVGVSRSLDRKSKKTLLGFAPVLVGLTRSVFPDWKIADRELDVLAVAVTGALSQAALHWHQEEPRVPRATMISAVARVMLGIRLTIEADLAADRSHR